MEPGDYNVIGIGCDVSSELSVQQAYRRVMDTYGRVDSVVASAGSSSPPLAPLLPSDLFTHHRYPGRYRRELLRLRVRNGASSFLARPTDADVGVPASSFSSYPFDRIKRLYDINVHGAFFTAREAARNMIPQGGGSVVLVASMSANVSSYPINLRRNCG